MRRTSLVAQTLKNLPTMQETWVWSLGGKDALEKSGNPLQYSCLENFMDRGAWWVTVCGIAKSQTGLGIKLGRKYKWGSWGWGKGRKLLFISCLLCAKYWPRRQVFLNPPNSLQRIWQHPMYRSGKWGSGKSSNRLKVTQLVDTKLVLKQSSIYPCQKTSMLKDHRIWNSGAGCSDFLPVYFGLGSFTWLVSRSSLEC